MSQRATEFTNDWLAENVYVGPYTEPGDPDVVRFAEQLAEAAAEAGIPVSEIEEEFGDLQALAHRTLDRATDEHVKELAAKDD